MKLDLLHSIAKAVRDELLKDGLNASCHYMFKEEWHPLDGDPSPLTAFVSHALHKSTEDSVAYHAAKSKTAWFYLAEFQATISVDFPTSPRLATRQSLRKKIEEIRRNAVNAFKVSHNELTGLLSRDAFRERLRNSIAEVDKGKPKKFVLDSEGQSQNTVSILAFDIDKFKQVNDTYGHIYGDQVLKAFAWRLERATESLRKEYGSNVRITLGHPSGEEFLALIEGQFTNEELSQIAEAFRLCIADEPLPSDSEWARLLAAAELEKVRLPSKTERSITTSVGTATYTGSASSDSSIPLVMLDKADVALYKSKSGGRNRVTSFEDILQRCGRVLEHDPNTGVVAIDVGSKVGALVGQEFSVFPPTYTGATPYTIDDGRSKKTLGTYPRIEFCRIVVFNSQSDISFAYLTGQTSTGKIIPSGALLEAVPLGSITHLIEYPPALGNLGVPPVPQAVSGGSELQEHVDQLIKDGKSPFAAVLRFKLESEFHKKYGSAAVNRALAQFFLLLRTKYADGNRVGLIDKTAICVVGEASKFNPDEISELLNEAPPLGDELAPICGCYEPLDVAKDNDHPVNLDQHAIELARYTLSDSDGFKDKRIQTFSPVIAERILTQHRKSRTFKSGVTDYLRLKEIGITTGNIENNGGLCYSALGENSLSIECYLRAVELSPDNIIFRGNVAVLAVRTNQIDLGLKALSKIKREKLDIFKKLHPRAFWAYAVLLAEAKDLNSPFYDSELLGIVGPAACEMENSASKPEYSKVRMAVDSLAQ